MNNCPHCGGRNILHLEAKTYECHDCGEEITASKATRCLYDSTKENTITQKVRVNASSDSESCPNCGGWGGGAWNGNDSPFQGYLPCYKCGL
jgi:hypothetical protein